MVARRLRLTIVASLCGLICVFVVGVAPAAAGATQFGAEGHAAGQFGGALGLGLDQETGDVYVGEFGDERVSKFDESGSFLFAWGWGVDEEHPAEELQTCTAATGCLKGLQGSGAGEFASSCGAESVAVDNDPLSFSYKDVYVVDFCNHRVQKFDSSGKFLLMFGGHVNEAKDDAPAATEAEKDVCVAGEACTEGSEGSGDGEFEWAYEHSFIAVGPDGAVYVGDKARVQVFEPSGAWRENVSLAGLSSTGKVTALAVDSAGDVFLADEGVAGVRELEPGGIEKAQLDAGSTSIEAITVDKSGDLFVADGAGGFHVGEYDSAGVELASFGAKTAGSTGGIVFSESLDRLYVSTYTSVWVLTPPVPGPVVELESELATPELNGAATLEATVDPEGNATSVHFEYVDEKHFEESGYVSATSTAGQSIGSGFGEEHVEVHLPAKALVPGATYHWRVVAVDSSNHTSTGPDQSFEATPAALVDGPWASDVAGTSVTLNARIDPQGVGTSYRLEYGMGSSYEHVLSGNVGGGTGYVTVGYHIQELSGHTTYHYRLVTVNEVGTVETVDHSFTTEGTSEALLLPDGRAWELVSPPNKEGALIESGEAFNSIQASADGSRITYLTSAAVGEEPVGNSGPFSYSQVLSTRGPAGWRSADITAPQGVPKEEEAVRALDFAGGYEVFSPDLSWGALTPGYVTVPLSSEATERTLYLRNDANGSFIPLVTPSDVPPGTKFDTRPFRPDQSSMEFFGASPDLSHIVLASPTALTPGALESPECTGSCAAPLEDIYEWAGGQLRLVSVMPDGKTLLGGLLGFGNAAHAVSSDGRWIVWRFGQGEGESYSHLYVRDMVKERTVQLGGTSARFQTMSSDGSRIFYLENGELYEYDTETGVQIDVTTNYQAGESGAGVKDAVLGVSENGSYIYFVATGVLANGATKGEDNLYISRDNGSEWTTTYVATLSGEDEKDWIEEGSGDLELWRMTARVSPDGRYLAFMSDRSLTGYDNIDAVSGQRDEEVYLYDAAAGRLACASCDTTGARPVGVLDSTNASLLVDRTGAWAPIGSSTGRWLAGSVPAWNNLGDATMYQPRYLSDSGRLFFDSPDALVPQDTNGLEDAYEYEPLGVGNCTLEDTTFNDQSRGCVDLVSSGKSNGESAFLDASEDGDDAFFVTASRLTAADYDTSYDVYDAHVCSASAPCGSLSVPPPPCSSGDSCKGAPSPQPEIFGAPPSATFSGTGNVIEGPEKGAVKHSSKAKPKIKPKKHAKKRKRMAKKAHRSSGHRVSGKDVN